MTSLKADHQKIATLEAATASFRAHRFDSPDWGLLRRASFLFRSQFRSYYFQAPPPWKLLLRMRSNAARVLPAFASVGAVRSGTSAMSEYLFQHPCVVLPLAKEVVAMNSAQLRAHFPLRQELERVEQRLGCAMTGYCCPVVPSIEWPHLAKNAAPDAKIILLLRNPVDRAFSHWKWERIKQRQLGAAELLAPIYDNFNKLALAEMEAIAAGGGGVRGFTGSLGCVQDGVYYPFVRALLEHFERDQIHFVNSEEFFRDAVGVVKKVYTFLELPPYEPIEMQEKNPSPKAEMDPQVRSKLRDFYRPSNERLYELIGRDLRWS